MIDGKTNTHTPTKLELMEAFQLFRIHSCLFRTKQMKTFTHSVYSKIFFIRTKENSFNNRQLIYSCVIACAIWNPNYLNEILHSIQARFFPFDMFVACGSVFFFLYTLSLFCGDQFASSCITNK